MIRFRAVQAAATLGLTLVGGCLPTDTEEVPLFSVEGRVVNSCGKPMVGLSLSLGPERDPDRGSRLTRTDGDGRFRFAGVRGYASYLLRLGLPAGIALRPDQAPEVRVPIGNVAPPSVNFHVQDPGEYAQVTLLVAPQTRTCRTWYGAPMQCLLVRESPGKEWFAIERVDGFQHEPGFEHELLVVRHNDPCPPADAPGLTYRLVRVIAKRAAPQG